MTHVAQYIEFKKLNDGQFALLAECCGDFSTRSYLTLYAGAVVDDPTIQAALNAHLSKVANLHETATQAAAILPTLLNQPVQIVLPAPAQPSEPVSPDPAPTPTAPTAPSDPSTPA